MESKKRPEIPIKWIDDKSVNWSLYPKDSKQYYLPFPCCDFRKTENKALALALHIKEEDLPPTRTTELKLSKSLQKFITDNCPTAKFYEPETIASLLTPSSNILASYTKSKDKEMWKFRLNPKYNDVPGSFNIERGLNGKRTRQPYLTVMFNAYYDGINFVYFPYISDIYRSGNGSSLSSPILQKELLSLLCVKKGPAIEQPVECNVEIDLFTPKELFANVKIDLKK